MTSGVELYGNGNSVDGVVSRVCGRDGTVVGRIGSRTGANGSRGVTGNS